MVAAGAIRRHSTGQIDDDDLVRFVEVDYAGASN